MFTALVLAALISSSSETECLFVLTHAGETNELLPFIEEMQKQNRDYRVIALNVAKDLVKEKIPSERLIETPIKAKKVITGVSSNEHKYYLDLYRGKAETFAYWDNPEPRGAVPYFSTALKVQAAADKVLFPSGFVASAREFQYRPESEKIVVGKPTLSKFLNMPKREGTSILFVGTYGGGYEKALALFAKSVESLPDRSRVVFQRHPMAQGDHEEKYANALGASVSKTPLLEAMAQARVVVTYNSSSGFQALVGGKPIVYVVPEGDGYSNSLIENTLAPKATNVDEVLEALHHLKANSSPEEVLSSMQIPFNPVERFFQIILNK